MCVGLTGSAHVHCSEHTDIIKRITVRANTNMYAEEIVLCLVITLYICHSTVPSMAARWLFNRPWSGFGGSGGGVFSCLMSDSSTAPAEVCWQDI